MLYEQYHLQDLLTPSALDGGIQTLDSSLTSCDFYLLDDINLYLDTNPTTKAFDTDVMNDSQHNYRQIEEFFSDIDFDIFSNFDKDLYVQPESITNNDIDIEKYISQSSFPSPPSDTSSSSSIIEDPSSISSSFGDEYITNTDMIVPPSPSLLLKESSSIITRKRTKLTPQDRKQRKKNQNKTAAEKYRIKKKSERYQLLDQHTKLKDRNNVLKTELEDLTYRVQQLKQLLHSSFHINPSIST